MDHATLEEFRRRLLGRRISLLNRRQRALAGEHELLAEREPDWEDAAASSTAVSVLESLSESERSGLVRIQTALERIEQGTYDECAACRGPMIGNGCGQSQIPTAAVAAPPRIERMTRAEGSCAASLRLLDDVVLIRAPI